MGCPNNRALACISFSSLRGRELAPSEEMCNGCADRKSGSVAIAGDHRLQPVEPSLDLPDARAEGEADVLVEAGEALGAAVSGVHVEEDAGHADDLVLERGPEEVEAVRDRLRQVAHRDEEVERPGRLGED